MSAVAADLKDQVQKLAAALAKFEKDQKAAIDIITPYMKKAADPAAVDANKKIEDFKTAAKSFREAGVAMTAVGKDFAEKVGDHAKEAEGVAPATATGLKDQLQKLAAALAKFEKDQKAAIDIITPYMKKAADPAAVDANKKIEDFKTAAKSFREAGVALATVGKETSEKVGEYAKDVETASTKPADASAAPASSGASPSMTPGSTPRTPRDPAGAADGSAASTNNALKEAYQKITELEKKEISLMASHQEELLRCKSQSDAATFAYHQIEDKLHITEESLQTKISEMKETIAKRDEALREFEKKTTELKASETKLTAERNGLGRNKAELIQRLSYADRSRDNEFQAFEHAMREHEREIHNWQTKYADVVATIERMRLEKQALEARVADEHLREHIRVLQKENNALREERIQALHEGTKEPAVLSHLTQVLQENIAALERENLFLNERSKQLHADVAEREKNVAEALQNLMEEKRRSQLAADNYTRRIRVLEFDQAMSVVQIKSATYDSTASHEKERSFAATAAAALDIVTWDKGLQVDDVGRRDLEREVLSLRALAADLEELRSREEEDRHRMQSDLEDRLMQQMKAAEMQLSDLSKEVKIRSFKLTKLQASHDTLKQQLAQSQATLAATRAAAPVSDDAKLWAIEKRLVACQLENEELLGRNKNLKREMQVRQDESDERMRSQVQQQDRSAALRAASAGGSQQRSVAGETKLEALAGGGAAAADGPAARASASPAASSLSSQRYQRLAEMEAIDHGLLDLHQKSIALDSDAARATEEFETTQSALQDRIAYLESSVVFWRSAKSTGHQGPNGESRTAMLELCQREHAARQADLQSGTEGIQKQFLLITRSREQILRETTSLMKRRAELD